MDRRIKRIESVPTTPVNVRRMNDLTRLAAAIRVEVEGIVASFRNGLLHAKQAGELLAKAHDLCCHGEWLPWLKANCGGISERTAQVYMQIADRWDELEAKAQRVTDLTINQARRLLAKPPVKDDGAGRQELAPAGGAAAIRRPVDDTDLPAEAVPESKNERKPEPNQGANQPKHPLKVMPFPGVATPPTPGWDVDGSAAAPRQSGDDAPPPKENPHMLLVVLVKVVQLLTRSVAAANDTAHPTECAKALDEIVRAAEEIRKGLPHA